MSYALGMSLMHGRGKQNLLLILLSRYFKVIEVFPLLSGKHPFQNASETLPH